MLFDETYEEYMALYTEAEEAPKEEVDSNEEDNETAKKIGKRALKVAGKAAKGTAKLAGKSALAFADYMTDGDVSKGIDFVKSSYEDGEDSDSNEEDAERVDKDRMK